MNDFYTAWRRIPGLEYLGDEEAEFDADADFAAVDKRAGREGQVRDDKPVVGRLYLAMPDIRALHELVRLWDRYQAGGAREGGLSARGSTCSAACVSFGRGDQ